jgi:hypothetical protein
MSIVAQVTIVALSQYTPLALVESLAILLITPKISFQIH